MNRRRHAIAMVICVAMVLSMLVSSAYIVHETAHHHDCTGEHCPVCQCIAQIARMKSGLGGALLALLMVFFAVAVGRARYIPAATASPVLCTLVGRKIRLND